MITYRAGQRVRIEWPNGDALEATAVPRPYGDLMLLMTGPTTAIWMEIDCEDGRTVTVLSEPRPDEPQGLGAVVEDGYGRWTRWCTESAEMYPWISAVDRSRSAWINIGMNSEIQVLSEGVAP